MFPRERRRHDSTLLLQPGPGPAVPSAAGKTAGPPGPGRVRTAEQLGWIPHCRPVTLCPLPLCGRSGNAGVQSVSPWWQVQQAHLWY